MYTPNRPRRPFLRPYQPPSGLSAERPQASTLPSGAGFCSSAPPSGTQSPFSLSIAMEVVDRPSVVEEAGPADLADDGRRVGGIVALHLVLRRSRRGLEDPRIVLGAAAAEVRHVARLPWDRCIPIGASQAISTRGRVAGSGVTLGRREALRPAAPGSPPPCGGQKAPRGHARRPPRRARSRAGRRRGHRGRRRARPEHEYGQATRPAGRPVGVIGRPIDPEAGPVVLHHRVDRGRVVDRAAVVLVVLDRPSRPGRPGTRRPDRRRIARSGLSGWPKKNQCGHACAKRASARASASPIGTASRTARCVTESG